MDSSISLDDANAFYEALGLTPPEEVNENTTGGRTRQESLWKIELIK